MKRYVVALVIGVAWGLIAYFMELDGGTARAHGWRLEYGIMCGVVMTFLASLFAWLIGDIRRVKSYSESVAHLPDDKVSKAERRRRHFLLMRQGTST